MSSWDVSVVIPTFNRIARLRKVLQALDAQDALGRFEVVVVDDGSSDGTRDVLEAQKYGFELRVLSQANAGPAAARNRGIEAGRGDFILFIDDDVVPEPHLVRTHLESHERAGAEVVVLGTLSSLPTYAQPWVAWEQLQLEKLYAAMVRGDFAPSYRQFWTGNASVRRRHLVDAGLFDTSLRRGEDVELGRRLAALGVGFVFNIEAKGWHHAERTLESFCDAHATYGVMEVSMFEQVPATSVEEVLGGNWNRLHVSQRAVLGVCLQSEFLARGVESAVKSYLKGASFLHHRAIDRVTCSLLANLLYWRSSSRTLGPERFATVRRPRPV